MRRSPVEAVWLILKVLNRYSFIGAVGLEQPNAAAWLTTSKPPPCHEYWAEPLSFSHQLTFHLYLTPNILPPRFQYAALHPSFLRRFHLPSLYISLTHFPALFRSFFCPPPPLTIPASLRCPSPSKAIILLPFSLYLHDTEVLSEAGADGKRQAFTKRLRFNIFPLLFITTQELHSRTNSPARNRIVLL